jgi:hypothetical protein
MATSSLTHLNPCAEEQKASKCKVLLGHAVEHQAFNIRSPVNQCLQHRRSCMQLLLLPRRKKSNRNNVECRDPRPSPTRLRDRLEPKNSLENISSQ